MSPVHIKKAGWQRTLCGRDITERMSITDFTEPGAGTCKMCVTMYARHWDVRRRPII